MGFLDAFKRKRQPWDERLPDGRSVYEAIQGMQPDQPQMPQQPQPTRQVLTPTNQENITRPRTVSPFIDRLNQTRPRIADPTSFDAEHLREIESQPLGLRGKAGLVAQNIATNLGYHPLQTRRQRDIGEVENRLGRDIALDKNRVAIQQGQMVPFQLPDGTITTVPAKTAGMLASRQQGQQANLAERTRMNNAHQERWKQMGVDKGREQAMREYATGMYDDNPEMLDYLGKTYTENGQALPPVRTQVTVGDQTFKVKPEAAASIATRTSEGEKGRAAAMERSRYSQAQQNQRAGMRRGKTASDEMTLPQKVAAEKLVARYNFTRKQEMDTKTPAEQKRLLQKQREALGNQIYATYPGMFEEAEGGEIRAKTQAASPPAPSSNVTEQQIRDAAKAKGLDPDTAVERARKRGLIQ